MCSPYVLAGVNMVSQAMAIQAQNTMLGAQAQASAEAAVASAQNTYSALDQRASEENLQTSVEKSRRMRQGLRERSTVASRMAESGLSGNVAVRDLVGSLVLEAEDVGILETNREITMRQIEREKQGVYQQGLRGIQQAKETLKQRTSPLSATLQILGAGLEGYSRGEAMMAPSRARRATAKLSDEEALANSPAVNPWESLSPVTSTRGRV